MQISSSSLDLYPLPVPQKPVAATSEAASAGVPAAQKLTPNPSPVSPEVSSATALAPQDTAAVALNEEQLLAQLSITKNIT